MRSLSRRRSDRREAGGPGQDRATAVAVEGLLRVAAVLAVLSALALLLGQNGLGVLPGGTSTSRVGEPLGLRDAYAGQVTERTEVTGEPGLATVRAVNDGLGPLGSPVGPGEVEVSGPTEVTVAFSDVTDGQRWAWVLVRALPALGGAVALWLLASLVATARRGDPFTNANVRRLTWVTGLVLVGGTTADLAGQLVRRWLLDTSELAEQVPVEATLSLAWVGAGLLLAVITEVWRRGVAMRADLEGLV